jgi:hypothetical protein
LASKNRSTHCLMQGSSYLSSLPFLIVPAGMHLRKHVSVREWIAVQIRISIRWLEYSREEFVLMRQKGIESGEGS